MKSIMQNEDKCYICGRTDCLETHHIFGAASRGLSDRYGLTVSLCHWHHNEPPHGVHFNRENDLFLKEEAQRQFESHYTQSFIDVFGRNYL